MVWFCKDWSEANGKKGCSEVVQMHGGSEIIAAHKRGDHKLDTLPPCDRDARCTDWLRHAGECTLPDAEDLADAPEAAPKLEGA